MCEKNSVIEKIKNDCLNLIDEEIKKSGCVVESKDDFIYTKDIYCLLKKVILKNINMADMECCFYSLYEDIMITLRKKYKSVADDEILYFYDNQYSFNSVQELEKKLGYDIEYAFENAKK